MSHLYLVYDIICCGICVVVLLVLLVQSLIDAF